MSIHGICFDEGMSGNCGLECRGFLDMECDIVDEVVEGCADSMTQDDWIDLGETYEEYMPKIIFLFGE